MIIIIDIIIIIMIDIIDNSIESIILLFHYIKS